MWGFPHPYHEPNFSSRSTFSILMLNLPKSLCLGSACKLSKSSKDAELDGGSALVACLHHQLHGKNVCVSHGNASLSAENSIHPVKPAMVAEAILLSLNSSTVLLLGFGIFRMLQPICSNCRPNSGVRFDHGRTVNLDLILLCSRFPDKVLPTRAYSDIHLCYEADDVAEYNHNARV